MADTVNKVGDMIGIIWASQNTVCECSIAQDLIIGTLGEIGIKMGLNYEYPVSLSWCQQTLHAIWRRELLAVCSAGCSDKA